jgi:hypothetical protein
VTWFSLNPSPPRGGQAADDVSSCRATHKPLTPAPSSSDCGVHLTARYHGDAAAYGVPRNPVGPVPPSSAGLSLRPSQGPARLTPSGELRAGR